MVAVTPVLRAELIFKPARAQDRGPGYGNWDGLELDRVPYVLVAVHTLARLAQFAGMQEVTYQTILRLFHDFQALLFLLAHADSVVAWRPGVAIDLALPRDQDLQLPYIRLARALLPRRQHIVRARLGDILCEVAPVNGVLRLRYLQLVAQRLEGRVTALDGAWFRRVRTGHGVRCSLQRWALQHVSEQLLAVALEMAGRCSTGAQ